MTSAEVQAKLQELGIRPLKSLGQNFLVDKAIVAKIIEAGELSSHDKVTEIGPGLGSLTELLSKEKLQLIELDKTLANYWSERGYNTHHGDALKFDWSHASGLLISNLPYQISSRILVELFCQGCPFESMVLMFQREVGDRIKASPSDKKIYGLLSVVCQLGWEVRTVTKAPAPCFFPRPDVESVVLQFTPRERALDDPKGFVSFLKALFGARRKKLSGIIKSKGYSLEGLDSGVLQARPDHLSPEELLGLYESLN